MNNTRVCNRCKWELPLNTTYFNVDNKNNEGFNTLCKQCRLEHRIKTKDKKRQYDELYRLANLERKEKYFAKWKEENRQKYLEGKKKYNRENADRQKVWLGNWVASNPERYNELKNLSTQRRLARKRELPDNYSLKEWHEALDYFNNECAYCGCQSTKLEKEHFIPLSKGGEFTKDNIIPSCMKCNRNKSNLDFFDWYYNRPYYSKSREKKILKFLGYKNNMQQLTLI